ncbi:hypothetical protein AB0F95_03975 [Micromonospora tulbaghiae]
MLATNLMLSWLMEPAGTVIVADKDRTQDEADRRLAELAAAGHG